MSKFDDGGAAFPYASSTDSNGDIGRGQYSPELGMSLRDWFAGQCMNQMIVLSQDRDGGWSTENVAAGCYNLADAMIAARRIGAI